MAAELRTILYANWTISKWGDRFKYRIRVRQESNEYILSDTLCREIKRAKKKNRPPPDIGRRSLWFEKKRRICRNTQKMQRILCIIYVLRRRGRRRLFPALLLLCLPKNFLSAGVTNIFLFQKSDRAKIRRHRRRE